GRDRPGGPRVRPGALRGGAAGGRAGAAAFQLQRDVRQPVAPLPDAHRAAGPDDRHLEQNEDDPDRLGSLFSMDHLVTRMRRNSENLLLLAGHENPRKWSDAVPLADVARAATSEIEQYNRIALNISPGVSV